MKKARIVELIIYTLLLGFYLNYVFWEYQDYRITVDRGSPGQEATREVAYYWKEAGSFVIFPIFQIISVAIVLVSILILQPHWFGRVFVGVGWMVVLFWLAFGHYLAWATWL